MAVANIAFDNASEAVYNDGIQTGDNGGFGFGDWSEGVLLDEGFAGNFPADTGGQLNTIGSGPAGDAWGTFANGGGVNIWTANRAFANTLDVGQTFSIQMENGFIQGFGSGFAGVMLTSGGPVVDAFPFEGATPAALAIGFNGGDSTYSIWAGGDPLDTPTAVSSIGFTELGVQFDVTNLGGGDYEVRITDLTIGVSDSLIVTLGAIDLDGFAITNRQTADGDVFFNNISIVPTPGVAVVLGLAGVVAGRRRR